MSSILHDISVHQLLDADAVGAAAAGRAADLLRARLAVPGRARICLAAAPSQQPTLAHLARAENIDFSRIDFFHMDDYVGLTQDAPQGFGNWLVQHFFALLPSAVAGGFHRIDVTADPVQAAADYAKILGDDPFDLLLCGLGINAHLAFNDPGSAFDDPERCRVITLAEESRAQQVGEGHFASVDEVPAYAITVTIPRLLNSHHVICSVLTAQKREAVTRTLTLDPTSDVPGTALKLHPDVHLYVDDVAVPRLAHPQSR